MEFDGCLLLDRLMEFLRLASYTSKQLFQGGGAMSLPFGWLRGRLFPNDVGQPSERFGKLTEITTVSLQPVVGGVPLGIADDGGLEWGQKVVGERIVENLVDVGFNDGEEYGRNERIRFLGIRRCENC